MQRVEPISSSQQLGPAARRISTQDATLEVHSGELEVVDLREPVTGRWLGGGSFFFASVTFMVGTAVLLATDAVHTRTSSTALNPASDRTATRAPSVPSAEARALVSEPPRDQVLAKPALVVESLTPALASPAPMTTPTAGPTSAPAPSEPAQAASKAPPAKAKLRTRQPAHAKRDRARPSAPSGVRSDSKRGARSESPASRSASRLGVVAR